MSSRTNVRTSSRVRSSRARSSASTLAAWRAAPVRAGADDDNDSEDGRVFEDDLEEGDEIDSHGGGGTAKYTQNTT